MSDPWDDAEWDKLFSSAESQAWLEEMGKRVREARRRGKVKRLRIRDLYRPPVPTRHTCPVCHWKYCEQAPRDHYICPSCGTHFGYDDDITSIKELRARWFAGGRKWWSHYYEDRRKQKALASGFHRRRRMVRLKKR